MSNQSISDSCFLCEFDSTYRRTDFGNRRAYKCSNPDCGEYEITNSAMERLAGADEFKEKAMQKAKACRDTEKILEIVVSSNQEVTATIRNR